MESILTPIKQLHGNILERKMTSIDDPWDELQRLSDEVSAAWKSDKSALEILMEDRRGKMNLLNIGCGSTYHPDWTNLDIAGGEGVIQHNVYAGLSFEDESFDAVYSSDLLEHLYRRFVPIFLRDCWRVLRPGGLIRIAAPDLEAAARSYLNNLYDAAQGDEQAQERYEWTVIELIDQLCRQESGGEMLDYWKRDPMPAEEYVYQRVGMEAKRAVASLRKSGAKPLPTECHPSFHPADVGRFRTSGQAHLWMYDRYSLKQLLQAAGFKQIRQCNADWSRIANFSKYRLDIAEDGSVRKPDSIFMEGGKE